MTDSKEECNWISTLYQDSDEGSISCIRDKKLQINYPCGEIKNQCFPYYITLSKGTYLVELKGAEGGNPISNQDLSGKGGSVSGILDIKEPVFSFYAYIGAQGVSSTGSRTTTVFNGGGSGYAYDPVQHVSSGGGGTDIRLNQSIYSRIIVAGGGGGGGYHEDVTTKYKIGGDGGGKSI